MTGLLLGVQRIAKITEERSKENEQEHASGDEEQGMTRPELLTTITWNAFNMAAVMY